MITSGNATESGWKPPKCPENTNSVYQRMTHNLTETQKVELRSSLSSGGKLAAVKLYWQWNDCSLKDAKSAVERFASEELAGEQIASDGSVPDDQKMDEILEEIANGRKLSAIKRYRTYSGKSLRESKEFIESLINDLGNPPLPDAMESSQSGCFSAILFVVSLSIAGAWLLVLRL